MSEEKNESLEKNQSLDNIEAEDILAAADGIPLPPAIKKSLWKSIGRLITGLVDVPVALLEAKSQKIKSEADGLSIVTKQAAEAAAKEFGANENLINRSVNHFGAKLLREQTNRESVINQATKELEANPPIQDSTTEIDDDWLETFSRIAETKSNEDVQLFLSKILAGEISKPGTFSAKTIQTLSFLDQTTAQYFTSFCNVSFEVPQFLDSMTCVISEPFGSAGGNGLASLGLSYDVLTQLQDAGLVKHDFNSYRHIPPAVFSLPHSIGTTQLSFNLSELSPKSPVKIQVLNFTKVGLELRKVLHISSNAIYLQKYKAWAVNKFKIT